VGQDGILRPIGNRRAGRAEKLAAAPLLLFVNEFLPAFSLTTAIFSYILNPLSNFESFQSGGDMLATKASPGRTPSRKATAHAAETRPACRHSGGPNHREARQLNSGAITRGITAVHFLEVSGE
jgi:hypothetical protein